MTFLMNVLDFKALELLRHDSSETQSSMIVRYIVRLSWDSFRSEIMNLYLAGRSVI